MTGKKRGEHGTVCPEYVGTRHQGSMVTPPPPGLKIYFLFSHYVVYLIFFPPTASRVLTQLCVYNLTSV